MRARSPGAALRLVVCGLIMGLGGCLFGMSDGGSGGEDTPPDQIYASRSAEIREMEAWSEALGYACTDCHVEAYTAYSEAGEVAAEHAELADEFEVDCAFCHQPGRLTEAGRRAARDMADETRRDCNECHGRAFRVTRGG